MTATPSETHEAALSDERSPNRTGITTERVREILEECRGYLDDLDTSQHLADGPGAVSTFYTSLSFTNVTALCELALCELARRTQPSAGEPVSDWIEWHGGTCPCPGAIVIYKTDDGTPDGWMHSGTQWLAENLNWAADRGRSQIIAYKVIHPAPAATPPDQSRVERLEVIKECAAVAYEQCASTRHAALGDKIVAALQALRGDRS